MKFSIPIEINILAKKTIVKMYYQISKWRPF